MRIEKFNHWLTLTANIGVIFGILLLVFELSQARSMMQAQTRNELSNKVVDLMSIPVGDDELLEITLKDRAGEELSEMEELKLDYRNLALFRYWENVHYQFRQGLYDEVEFNKQLKAVQGYMNGGRSAIRYWCEVRTTFSPEFMIEIDRLISRNACG